MEKWTENLDKTLKGFDGKKLDKLIGGKYGETFINQLRVYKTIRQEFGKVSRWNNYIDKFDKEIKHHNEKIEHYTKLKNKYEDLLQNEEIRYQSMLRLLKPKVTLKRPTKSFQYWRGKVWWGVGKGKEKGWVEFYIISDKKRLKKGLTEDDIRKLGQDIFKSKLMERDILDIIDG